MNLINVLSELCEMHTTLIKEAFWGRAKARLETLFYGGEFSSEECSAALYEGTNRAFEKDHWQFLVDCLVTDFGLVSKEIEKIIFAECDAEVLAGFVAGNNGLVANVLSDLSVANGQISDSQIFRMHMSLNGLNALIRRGSAEWQEPLCKVAGVFEGYCILLGGAPEHLQKRFDGILGGGKLPAKQPVAVPPTAPPRKINAKPKPASPPVHSEGATHNPFMALKGYKPNGAPAAIN